MINKADILAQKEQNKTTIRSRLTDNWSLTMAELVTISIVMILAARFFKMYRITDFMIFIIFVLSFDLLYGYMGHLSFGHMLYFGAGTYASAIFINNVSGNPVLGILFAVLFVALLSLMVGSLVMKTHGAAFALINMGFNQIGFFLVVSGMTSLTKGDDGMAVFPDPVGTFNLGNEKVLFYVVLGSLLSVFYLLKRLVKSPYGIMIRSIHENETRIKFLGYNTYKYKIITFVISCGLAGFAGALTTINYGYISPGFINPLYNVNPIFAILIGGAGNLYGAVIGGLIFKLLSEYIAIYITSWELVLGLTLLLMAFRFKKGITGALFAQYEKRGRKQGGA